MQQKYNPSRDTVPLSDVSLSSLKNGENSYVSKHFETEAQRSHFLGYFTHVEHLSPGELLKEGVDHGLSKIQIPKRLAPSL
jgi:hypothetical protein